VNTIRILVTDDYAPWRRHVCNMLECQPKLEVVGEASTGLEAVQKATELEPDVILLDISLPDLNGIEVASRILENVPRSKVIFLSQQNDEDLVRATLDAGAAGFLLKTARSVELLSAVEAAVRGDTYVTQG
jgi:DNA-binding NarL/FixJ family response regulator